jgi:hypothetical protein
MQKLHLLSATLGLLALASFPAEPADDIKPPTGYRHWFHVNTMIVDKGSPLFADLGGMHNVYVKSVAEAALKKGGPYPNKTMFATDLHEFTISDGSYVEGARKALAVMVKDSKKYASTGGWGFQLWAGGDPKKPQVTDAAKQCFACHQPKKTRTTSIPPTFREAGKGSATQSQHRLAQTRRGAANARRAKRREPRMPAHAIHARLSIGIGASWRDHVQYGRCAKEVL